MSSTDRSRAHSPRVARKRERARAEILEAAQALVRQHGLERLTIETIAAEADISKPAVYYYFASKEAVARALVAECSRDEIRSVRAAVEATPEGASVPSAVVRAYVDHHRDSMHLFRAEYVWGQVIGFDQAQIDAEVNPGMIELFDAVERRLQRDRTHGLLHDRLHLRRVAVSTWMAAHGLVATLGLIEAGGSKLLHDVDDVVAELCGVLTRGVYRGTPKRPRSGRKKPSAKR
jgi:AcrR family transcriptional regulator